MTIQVGKYVWLPCEVKPGPFSDERMVRVTSQFGDWVGFVPVAFLREPVSEGETLIQALIVEIRGDRFSAKLPGESLSSTLSWNALSQVKSVDPIEAGHVG